MTDIELSLTGMAHGGSAVGRVEGKAVFVPYAIAGERIRARIVQDKGRFAEAELLEVLDSSPHRVQPRCQHFGICGGCHWQHIDYAMQLELKRQIVHDQFIRIGGFKDLSVQPTLPSPDPWYYRSHISLHTTSEGQAGFVSTDQQTVIPIQECHIMRPELFAMLQHIPSHKEQRLQVGNTGKDRPEKVHYRVKDHVFQVSAGSFFQVNLPQAEMLVTLVLENLQLQGNERVLDLYSGVGLFTAFIAEHARHVTAIESSPMAVQDAKINLAAFKNVEILEGRAEAILKRQKYHAAITDPPRTGMKPKALNTLIQCRPQKIIYVSCDPSTLARDARQLAENGYRLTVVQPVDMFPQTYHIETVAVFS